MTVIYFRISGYFNILSNMDFLSYSINYIFNNSFLFKSVLKQKRIPFLKLVFKKTVFGSEPIHLDQKWTTSLVDGTYITPKSVQVATKSHFCT